MRAMQDLDKTDALSANELKIVEFTVYSYLDFSLLLSIEEYEMEFLSILARLGLTPEQYLGQALTFSGLDSNRALYS
jgi:hypothetical protein